MNISKKLADRGQLVTVTVSWDSELERVIFYRFDGQWTWDDFLRAFARELELVAGLRGVRYDVLAEVTRGTRMPAGPAITHVYGVYRRYPKNWGITVVATPNSFIRAMFNVGFTVHPEVRPRFFVVDDVKAGRAVIQNNRALAASRVSYQSR